jgi:hypothetical protein
MPTIWPQRAALPVGISGHERSLHMQRALTAIATLLAVLTVLSIGVAKDKQVKPGPLVGSWEGTAHGLTQGDVSITLDLDQQGEVVSGSVTTSSGTAEIAGGTFKNKKLQFNLDTPEESYEVTGKLIKGELRGEWTNSSGEKGTWEARKQVPAKT